MSNPGPSVPGSGASSYQPTSAPLCSPAYESRSSVSSLCGASDPSNPVSGDITLDDGRFLQTGAGDYGRGEDADVRPFGHGRRSQKHDQGADGRCNQGAHHLRPPRLTRPWARRPATAAVTTIARSPVTANATAH